MGISIHRRGQPPKRNRSTRLNFEALEDRRVLATFVVSSIADAGPGSLRDAVEQANASDGMDDIIFSEQLPSQTINLTTDEILILGDIRIFGNSSNGPITINLEGADPTPLESNGDGIRAFRSMPESVNPQIEFHGLSIEGGDVTGRGGAIYGATVISDCIFSDNAATEGGAFANLAGGLTISPSIFNSDFYDNQATGSGGAIHIGGYASAVMADLTLSGNSAGISGGAINASGERGDISIEDSTATGNSAGINGGGLYLNAFSTRDLTVRSVVISGNSTGGAGGGISARGHFEGSFESLTVENNSAAHDGGGISLDNDRLTFQISDSQIQQNTAGGVGGGVHVHLYRSAGLIHRTTIAGNSAGDDGGGIGTIDFSQQPPQLAVQQSTVSGNHSGGDGGGISGVGDLENSTVSGNTADGRGGGVIATGGSFTFATIVNNQSNTDENSVADTGGGLYANSHENTLEISHSILANNTTLNVPTGFPSVLNNDVNSAELVRADWTLIENAHGDVMGENNLFSVDPLLGQLADNGGNTLTHLPLEGSPVIDRGNPNFLWGGQFDQRGTPFSRIQDGNLPDDISFDLGAVEVQSLNVPPTAIAGEDLTAKRGSTIDLDGTASFDANQGPLPLSYLWEVIEGPALDAAFISNAAVAQPFFLSEVLGAYIVRLTVSDGLETHSDTLNIMVVEDTAPVASTRDSSLSSIVGLNAILSAEHSTDEDGDPIDAYQWRIVNQPAASSAALETSQSQVATFVPDVIGVYDFELVVRGADRLSSEPVTTRLSVESGPLWAGGPYVHNESDPVSLQALTQSPLSSSTSFNWDLDNDGQFDDLSQSGGLMTAETLSELHRAADNNVLRIGVMATDGNQSFTAYTTVSMVSDSSTDSWHNSTDALDVTNTDGVTPLDALLIINELNDRYYADLNAVLPPAPIAPLLFFDTNGNGFVEPVDAILVINSLNSSSGSIQDQTQVLDEFFASAQAVFNKLSLPDELGASDKDDDEPKSILTMLGFGPT